MFQKLTRHSRQHSETFCGNVQRICNTTPSLSFHTSLFNFKPAKNKPNQYKATPARGEQEQHQPFNASFDIASIFINDNQQSNRSPAQKKKKTKRTVDPSVLRDAKEYIRTQNSYKATNNFAEDGLNFSSILPPSFHESSQQLFASVPSHISNSQTLSNLFKDEFSQLDKMFDDFDQNVSCCDEQFHRAEKQILHILSTDDKTAAWFGNKIVVEGRACSFHYLGAEDDSCGIRSVMDQELTFVGKNKRKGCCHFRVQFYEKQDTYKITAVFVENDMGDHWTIDTADKLCIEGESCFDQECANDSHVYDCEFTQKH